MCCVLGEQCFAAFYGSKYSDRIQYSQGAFVLIELILLNMKRRFLELLEKSTVSREMRIIKTLISFYW